MAQKTNDYWTERLTTNQYKKHTKIMEKEILKVYKQANASILNVIRQIWLEMLTDGEISISSLNNKNRLGKIQEIINKELHKMGVAEIEILNTYLTEGYLQTLSEATTELGGALDTSYAQFNKEAINSIVNANFKGATWSDRIWINQDKLRELLKQNVIDSAILGKDVRKVSKDLSRRMEVSLSDSKRIVRTETMRVLNDGCINAAKERGYTNVEWLAEKDERLCDECRSMNGKIFPIEQAPRILHPNCRCTVLPVVE